MTATVKRHVRSGSAELCLEDTATGVPALVCLHAGVTDKRLWAPQLEASATHRVVACDRRGFVVQARIDEYEAAERRGDQAAVNEMERPDEFDPAVQAFLDRLR